MKILRIIFIALLLSCTARIATTQVIDPVYTYKAYITQGYDADTWRADIDVGFRMWRGGETLRLYAINTPEIKKSKAKGFTEKDVERGFDCRDVALRAFGLKPADYPRKASYFDIEPPVPVIIQTVRGNDVGKYGRLLTIVHYKGVNVNEVLVKSGCSQIELYDGKKYPLNTRITPDL